MTLYDRLTANPHPNDDDQEPPGTEPGEECGRYAEPDEDAPRGYRPKPCRGTMVDDDGIVICDTCLEVVR